MIEYFLGFNITHLQITLDGGPNDHNHNRPLINGQPTFDHILSNIKRAVNAGLDIIIRVNIWKPNAENVGELYDILESNGLKNKVRVIVKPVLSSSANQCQSTCLRANKSAKIIVGIYLEAAKKGWIVLPGLDYMQGHEFCIVDSMGQFIIDPLGMLYKCGECFDESESVGKIRRNGTFQLDEKKWMKWVGKDPLLFLECRRCALLPICMGGCSMKRYWKPEESPCLEFKREFDNLLIVMLLMSQMPQKKEVRDEKNQKR